MKYTIEGFDQKEACKLKLTCKELVFLRWFTDFMRTLKMKHIEVDNKVYFWVDNKTILSELPILGIKHPKNVRRFLRGIVKKEVLEYCLYKGYMPFYRIKHEKREARNMVDCPRMRKRVSFKRRGILSKDTQSFYNNTSIKNIIKDKLTKLD